MTGVSPQPAAAAGGLARDAQCLATALRAVDNGQLLVVTGAGVSLASGIPTFRGGDPGAVWKQDITELGTLRYFLEDPAGSWRWYLSRFDRVLTAVPNAAHLSLAALERWHEARGGAFLLVTQNVDTLHELAGSRSLVKVHGSADRVRCSRDGCQHGAPAGSLPRELADLAAFRANPVADALPRCPACGAILRQHVLWFDEYYHGHDDYQFGRVEQAARTMDLVLFVGTSFSVGVTDLFLQNALWRRVPAFVVDPGAAPLPAAGVTRLAWPAEALLPATLGVLGVRAEAPATEDEASRAAESVAPGSGRG